MRRIKNPWFQLLTVLWVEQPQWRVELNRHYEEILDKTGLSEDELEDVMDVLEQYRVVI